MSVRSILEYVGFNPREIRLYVSVLESGDSTASELASKSDMPLTTAEDVLRRMHKRGLVNSYMKRRRLYWVAVPPAKVQASFEEKVKAFESIVPKLEARRTADKPSLHIATYTGVHEIKLIMEDILGSKHQIDAVLPWDEWLDFMGEEFIDEFIAERRRRNLRLRMLTNSTDRGESIRRLDAKSLRVTKFLPKSARLEAIQYIYANKIALITLDAKRPSGLIIEDAAIAATARAMFERAWHSAE